MTYVGNPFARPPQVKITSPADLEFIKNYEMSPEDIERDKKDKLIANETIKTDMGKIARRVLKRCIAEAPFVYEKQKVYNQDRHRGTISAFYNGNGQNPTNIDTFLKVYQLGEKMQLEGFKKYHADFDWENELLLNSNRVGKDGYKGDNYLNRGFDIVDHGTYIDIYGLNPFIPNPNTGDGIFNEKKQTMSTNDHQDKDRDTQKMIGEIKNYSGWWSSTLKSWTDQALLKERSAIIKLLNSKKYKADPGNKNLPTLRARLRQLDYKIALVDERTYEEGMGTSTDGKISTEVAKETIDESEKRESLMVQTFIPESAERAFDRIQDKYISLRKGSKDQHLLSMYANQIIDSAAHSKTRFKISKGGGNKTRVFSLQKGLNTNRLTNIFSFKMENVTDKDYEGFLVNPLVTLTNAQLSALTPQVEFFIRTRGKNSKLTPIPLQNRGLSTNGQTGVAAINNFQSVLGLQDLTIRLAGDTPETAKRDIDATVTFYGSNLSVFSGKRGREFYVPLIQPEGLGGSIFGPKDLLMRIGWAEPSSSTQKALGFTPLQIRSIKKQMKTFVMSYYKHTFNFNEDGSFILQADYVSRVSETLQDTDVMSEGDSIVGEHYKDLNKKFVDRSYRKDLPKEYEKMVHEYINRVHPTVSLDTKKTIVEFFTRVKKREQVPKFIKRHTQYFQDKKSDKIKRCLNKLVDKSQMYRFAVAGSTIKERMFKTSFDRVIAPYYPTVAKNTVKDSDLMPPKISKMKVAEFKAKCRVRLYISSETTAEKQAATMQPPKIQRLVVTRDSSGKDLPGISIKLPDGSTKDITDQVNATKTKKEGGSGDSPATVKTIEKSDKNTTEGRAKQLEEARKQKEDAQEVARAKIKKGENKGENEASKKESDAAAADAEAEEKKVAAEITDGEHSVYYFRLGDIIDAFLEVSESEEYLKSEKVHIMLGNINIDGKFQNLYGIPISMQVYQKVMSDFENSTSRRLTLQRLISAFLKEVQRYFNQGDYVLDSGRYNSAHSIKCGQFRTDRVGIARLKGPAATIESLYRAGYGTESANTNESVFYYTMSQASTKLDTIDAKKLSKWEVGQDRSIIKKIVFKQVENQSMKAKQDDNIVKAFNSEQGLVMIPQLYNVDITSYGLLDFYPGLSFFIKPTLVGVDDINNSPVFKEVGITGLYNVINVEHKLSNSGFETVFKCYNEATIDWSEAIDRLKPGYDKRQAKKNRREASAAKKARTKAAERDARQSANQVLHENAEALEGKSPEEIALIRQARIEQHGAAKP